MSDLEGRLRRSARLRIGLIVALCVAIAIPFVAVFAASPPPIEQAPSPVVEASATPSTKPDDDDGDSGGKLIRGGSRGVEITAINGNRLSLTTEDGWTRTITITTATTIRKGGQQITVADLKVGDPIRFDQKRNDDGTYAIVSIQVPTPKVGGVVTTIDATTMTLERRGQSQAVRLTDATAYKLGPATGSRSDVKVGFEVHVQGTLDGDVFTAITVAVEVPSASGTVTSKTGTSMTMQRRDGTMMVVHVDDDTEYRVRGDETPAFADIVVGDRVTADGLLRADGSMDALRVREKKAKIDKPVKAPAASPGG